MQSKGEAPLQPSKLQVKTMFHLTMSNGVSVSTCSEGPHSIHRMLCVYVDLTCNCINGDNDVQFQTVLSQRHSWCCTCCVYPHTFQSALCTARTCPDLWLLCSQYRSTEQPHHGVPAECQHGTNGQFCTTLQHYLVQFSYKKKGKRKKRKTWSRLWKMQTVRSLFCRNSVLK